MPYLLGTFFEITATDTAQVVAYMGGLFTDMMPLLKIVIGIGAGLMILWGIVSAIKH